VSTSCIRPKQKQKAKNAQVTVRDGRWEKAMFINIDLGERDGQFVIMTSGGGAGVIVYIVW